VKPGYNLVPKHVCCKLLGVHHNTDPETILGPPDAKVNMLGNKLHYAWLYERIIAHPKILDEGNTYELCGGNWIARTLGIPRPKVEILMGKPMAYLMLGQKQSPAWTLFWYEEMSAKLKKAREAGDKQYDRLYAFTPRISAEKRKQIEHSLMLERLQADLNVRYLCKPRHILAADQVAQPMKPGWRRDSGNVRS
jgi:hypothetical protein